MFTSCKPAYQGTYNLTNSSTVLGVGPHDPIVSHGLESDTINLKNILFATCKLNYVTRILFKQLIRSAGPHN